MAMAAMRQRSSRSRGIARRRLAILSDANRQQRSTSLVFRDRRRRYQDHRTIVTVRLQPARRPDKVNTSFDECPVSELAFDLGCSENPDDMTSNTAVTLQNGYSNMRQKTHPAQQLHPDSIPPALLGHAQPALMASAKQAHNRCSYICHHRRRERKKYQPTDQHPSTSNSTGKH
jgi:hypothetical protein